MASSKRRRTIVVASCLALALVIGLVALSFVLRSPAAKARTVKVDPAKQRDVTGPTLVRMMPGNSGAAGKNDVEIEVRVRDTRGSAVGGADVWVVKDNPYYPRMLPGSAVRGVLVKSDAAGNVKFKFPKGPSNVLITRSGFGPMLLQKVTLEKTQPYGVELSDGRTIRGVVKDEKGTPLSGVSVKAARTDTPLDYLEVFSLRDTTDAGGNFVMANAGEGTYALTSEITGGPEGLFTAMTETTVTPHSDAEPIALLAQVGSVIKGKFVSLDGLKVSGREMYAYARSPKTSDWRVNSADDGSFVIKGIAAGASGGVSFNDGSGEFVHVSDPQRRAAFLSSSGGRSLQFRALPVGTYEGIEARVGKTTPASGVVKDEKGEPIAKAWVIVNDYRSYQTDAKGQYKAEVPTGEPVVMKVGSSETTEEMKAEPFTAELGKAVVKDFVTKRRVVEKAEETVSGVVLDEAGQPVPKARVELGNEALLAQEAVNRNGPKKPTWQGGTFWPARLVADGQGKFKFDMLYPGWTDVWAEDDKNRAGWVRTVKSGEQHVTVTLRAREPTLRIDGRVIDENGKGMKGKARLLTSENNTPEKLADAAVDSDGKFVFEAKTPQTQFQFLRFVFVSESGRIAWRSLPKCSGSFEIQVRPEAKISGVVKDSRGKALAGARVSTYLGKHRSLGELIFYERDLAEMMPAVTTDANGRFTLGGQPMGGTMSVIARAEGYEYDHAWHLELKEGTKDAGTITLQDAVSLEGTARFEDGKPAAGAVISMGWGSEERKTTTDDKGVYRFTSLHHNSFSNSYTQITAKIGRADEPDWEGSLRYEAQLQSGDRGTGADIVLKRSMQWRQRQWMAAATTTPTTVPASKYLMAVVDDVDRAYSGKEKFDDVVSLQDGGGMSRWRSGGLNLNIWFQAHGVMYHPLDKSIWVAANGLTKLKRDGSVEWTRPNTKANAMALDPKTNQVWVLTSGGNIYGDKLAIYNISGDKVKEQKMEGFELAYSGHDDCFWVIGQTLRKLDRGGKVLLESPVRFAWLASSITVNESDGSVWVVEHDHPQVDGSKDRVHIFEPDGRLRRSPISTNSWHVALDVPRGSAWVSGTPDGLVQLTLAGEIVRTVPVTSAGIAVEPDTGCVRLFGYNGSWRIDAKGNYLAGSAPSPPPKPGEGIASWVTVVEP